MKALVVLLAFLSFSGVAQADQTVKEAAAATANDAKRGVKKGANRVEEALCAKDDAKCLAEKAANRAQEGKDAVVDGTKKAADSVDKNKKANY